LKNKLWIVVVLAIIILAISINFMMRNMGNTNMMNNADTCVCQSKSLAKGPRKV